MLLQIMCSPGHAFTWQDKCEGRHVKFYSPSGCKQKHPGYAGPTPAPEYSSLCVFFFLIRMSLAQQSTHLHPISVPGPRPSCSTGDLASCGQVPRSAPTSIPNAYFGRQQVMPAEFELLQFTWETPVYFWAP